MAQRAVLEDPEDVAELVVAEVEFPAAGADLDRHYQCLPSGSIVHAQRYVPGPTRYAGNVSGPQLAVPRPRWAASRWMTVPGRGTRSPWWVAAARSAARKCVADTWRG